MAQWRTGKKYLQPQTERLEIISDVEDERLAVERHVGEEPVTAALVAGELAGLAGVLADDQAAVWHGRIVGHDGSRSAAHSDPDGVFEAVGLADLDIAELGDVVFRHFSIPYRIFQITAYSLHLLYSSTWTYNTIDKQSAQADSRWVFSGEVQ